MSVIKRRSTLRHGVSLLEILICIGILSVGLLGVVSLIPVGHFALNETNKADRSTACAKSAKAQAEIRGLIDPTEWKYFNTGGLGWIYYDPVAMPAISGSTIVLDPLSMSYAIADNVTSNANFPFNLTPNTAPSAHPYLTRYSIDDCVKITGVDALGANERISLCELICRWSDDTQIEKDDTDPDLRPRQVFTSDDPNDNYGPYPVRTSDDPQLAGNVLTREIKGDFSWFLTITPDLTEVFLPIDEMKNFEVSVVVCYKRDFSMDNTVAVLPERMVNVDLDPASFSEISGTGASDIPLALPNSASDIEEKLEVKPGQWIMLVGQQTIVDTSTIPPTPQPRTIAKWYRILSVDDELDDKNGNNITFTNNPSSTEPGQIRWVTVTGPEWRSGTMPGEIQNTHAVIVDGVIGVFTETMTLDK